MSETQIRGNVQIMDGTITQQQLSFFPFMESPSGARNGVNEVFTLTNEPLAGAELVLLNGIVQESGAGNDYTLFGSIVTFTTPPASTDKILVYTRMNGIVGGGGPGGGFTPFQWSASEQIYTLEKNKAGNTLYAVEVDIGALPNSTSKAVAHGIVGFNPGKLFQMYGTFSDGSTADMIPYSNQGPYDMVVYIDNTYINLIGYFNLSPYTGTMRVIYWK